MSAMSDYFMNQLNDNNSGSVDSNGNYTPATNFIGRSNYNPEFGESAWNNFVSGVQMSAGGTIGAIGQNMKTWVDPGMQGIGSWLKNNGDYLMNESEKRSQQYGLRNDYHDMGLFDRLTSADYLTDTRGLLADVTQGAGSSLPTIAAMAIPVPGSGAGAFAARAGIGAVAGGLSEAASDSYGNMPEFIKQANEQGLTGPEADKYITDRLNSQIRDEVPALMLSNALTSVAGRGIGSKFLSPGAGMGKRALANTGVAVADATGEYGTEVYQNLLGKEYANKEHGDWWNPFTWEADDFGAGASGFVGGMGMSGPGAIRDTIMSPNVAPPNDINAKPQQDDDEQENNAVHEGLMRGFNNWKGQRMDNGENGCVEAVVKMGSEYSPWLSEQWKNGVMYAPTLLANAQRDGIDVVPFDPSQLEEGDIIVYDKEGDEYDPNVPDSGNNHVVIYDGKGGYVGNSSSRQEVIQSNSYELGGGLHPARIIKTGRGDSVANNTPASFSGNADIDNLLMAAAQKYNVPVDLLAAMAETESGFNQDAQSGAGALGIMQLMPETAAGLGVDPTSLEGNIEGGAKYLRQMLDYFNGDVDKAIQAYNAGPGAVESSNALPQETVDYLKKVNAARGKYQGQRASGTAQQSSTNNNNDDNAERELTYDDYRQMFEDDEGSYDNTESSYEKYLNLIQNFGNVMDQIDAKVALDNRDTMDIGEVARNLGYGQQQSQAQPKPQAPAQPDQIPVQQPQMPAQQPNIPQQQNTAPQIDVQQYEAMRIPFSNVYDALWDANRAGKLTDEQKADFDEMIRLRNSLAPDIARMQSMIDKYNLLSSGRDEDIRNFFEGQQQWQPTISQQEQTSQQGPIPQQGQALTNDTPDGNGTLSNGNSPIPIRSNTVEEARGKGQKLLNAIIGANLIDGLNVDKVAKAVFNGNNKLKIDGVNKLLADRLSAAGVNVQGILRGERAQQNTADTNTGTPSPAQEQSGTSVSAPSPTPMQSGPGVGRSNPAPTQSNVSSSTPSRAQAQSDNITSTPREMEQMEPEPVAPAREQADIPIASKTWQEAQAKGKLLLNACLNNHIPLNYDKAVSLLYNSHNVIQLNGLNRTMANLLTKAGIDVQSVLRGEGAQSQDMPQPTPANTQQENAPGNQQEAEQPQGESAQNADNKKAADESGNTLSPKDSTLEFLKNLYQKPITNKATGITAAFGRTGASKMVSNKAVQKSKNNGFSLGQHLEAVRNIKSIFEDAELSETHPDRANDPNIVEIKRFRCDTIVDNEKAIAKITVKETVRNGHKIYSVELEALEKPSDSRESTATNPSLGSESPTPKGLQGSATSAEGPSIGTNVPQNQRDVKENVDNKKAADNSSEGTPIPKIPNKGNVNPHRDKNGEWVNYDGNKIGLPLGYITESGDNISEADGREYILKSNGEFNFGTLGDEVYAIASSKDSMLRNLPIRLQVGNEGFGFIHSNKHLYDASKKGFDNVLSYMEYVLKNFTQLYKQDEGRYVLYCADKTKGFMPIDMELERREDEFYTIISVNPHGPKIKGTLLYDGGARPSTAITNGQLTTGSNNNGEVTPASANVPVSNVPQNQRDVNSNSANSNNRGNENITPKQKPNSEQTGYKDKSAQNEDNKKAADESGIVTVTGDELGEYNNIKDLIKKAEDYYRKNLQGTQVENKELGIVDIDDISTVNFTRSGIDEMTNHARGANKLLLVKYLPKLISEATRITSAESRKSKHEGEYFYYLNTEAMFEGNTYPVKITLIKRNNGTIQYYDHYMDMKNGKKNEGASASTGPASSSEALGFPSLQHAPSVDFNVPQGQYDVKGNFANIGVRGKETAVDTDDKKTVKVVYRYVPADSVITSNIAEAGMPTNDNYPKELQPRNRQRGPMQNQVWEIAGQLDPKYVAGSVNLNQGAPVVRNDGVVLNGNGRAMALSVVLRNNKNGKADTYHDYLRDHAAEFGMKPEDIDTIPNGILVREVVSDLDKGLTTSIIESNAGGARLGASEQAKIDAGKIKTSTLRKYQMTETGDISKAGNREFVVDALNDIVPSSEMNAYINKNGDPTPDGVARVQRALFALAYGDVNLLDSFAEDTSDETKNLTNALRNVAPMVAQLRRGIENNSYDNVGTVDAIVDAIHILKEARKRNVKVDVVASETSLFGENQEELTSEHTPEAVEIAKTFEKLRRSGKQTSIFLKDLVGYGLQHVNENMDSMFDVTPLSLMDDINHAKGEISIFDDNKKAADESGKKTADEIKQDLLALAQDVWNGEKGHKRVSFVPSKKFRDKAKELFGHDVDEIFITSDDVRHIKKRHSDGQDKLGQINITVDDIADIYDIVNDFDVAEKRRDDKKGNQNLMTIKSNDGRSYVLLVERGTHKAEIKTYYKKKESAPMSDAISPDFNVRNDSEQTPSIGSNIPQNQRDVKENVDNKKAADESGTKSIRDKVIEKLRGIKNSPITNKATGIVASFGVTGINKMTSNAAINKSMKNGFTRNEHLEAVSNIVSLYENATLSQVHGDKNNALNVLSIKRFVSAIDKDKIALITVKESLVGGHRIYSLELDEIKKAPSDRVGHTEMTYTNGALSADLNIPQNQRDVKENSTTHAQKLIGPARHITAKAAAKRAMEILRGSGIDVITDTKEMERVLGEPLQSAGEADTIQRLMFTYEEGERPADLTLTQQTINGKSMYGVAFIGNRPKNYVPKKIGKAYKLMEQWPDGSLHALFAGTDKSHKMGEWNWAAGFTPDEKGGIKTMNLAPRYGWHMGTGVPASYHLMGVGDVLNPKMVYPTKSGIGHPKGSKRVWVEVHYDATNDYTDVAEQNPGREKDIRGLIPFGGYYMFQEGNLSNWIIASSIKFDHILTDSERQKILDDAGYNEELVWRKQVVTGKLKAQLTADDKKLSGERALPKNETMDSVQEHKAKIQKLMTDNEARIKELNDGKDWKYKKRSDADLAAERERIRKMVYDNPELKSEIGLNQNDDGTFSFNFADTQFLRTPQGEVYGFVKDGKIYIDENKMDASVPIHEYTHVWDNIIRETNPELWKRGVELMKKTPYWNEVKSNPAYKDIANDDNLVASEVHAMLTGNRGRELLEAAEISPSVMDKLKKWANDFWKALKNYFTQWSKNDADKISVNDFINMPLADFINQVNLKEIQDKVNKDKRTIYNNNQKEHNNGIEFDGDSPVSQRVFDTYLNDGIKQIIRKQINDEIGNIENIDELSDPVKMDKAFANMPYIKHMRSWFFMNAVKKNDAYLNRMAVKYEYARRCFLYDGRIPNGIVRQDNGMQRQEGIHGAGAAGISRNNPRGNTENDGGAGNQVIPVQGEFKSIKKHFDSLVDDMQQKMEEEQKKADKQIHQDVALKKHSHDYIVEHGAYTDTALDKLPWTPVTQLRKSEKAIQSFGRSIGVPIHFVSLPSEAGNRGVITHNGEIFINRRANVPASDVFGHEFTHWLKSTNPQAYDLMRVAVENGGTITKERLDAYRKKIYEGDKLTDEEVIDEMICDAVTNTKAMRDILQGIENINPSISGRIMGYIRSMLDSFFNAIGFNPRILSGKQSLPNGLRADELTRLNAAVNSAMLSLQDYQGNKIFKNDNGKIKVANGNEVSRAYSIEPVGHESHLPNVMPRPVRYSRANNGVPDPASPLSSSIKNMIGRAFDNLKHKVGVTVRAEENVEVRHKKGKNEIGGIAYWAYSPQRIAKAFPKLAPIVNNALRASDVQERHRANFTEAINKAMEELGYRKNSLRNDPRYNERMKVLNNVLLNGDTNRKEFTEQELRNAGCDEQVIKAYQKIRQTVKDAWNVVNDAKQGNKYHSIDVSQQDLKSKLAELNGSKFTKVLGRPIWSDTKQSWTVNYRETPVWERNITITQKELDNLKNNPDVEVLSETDVTPKGKRKKIFKVQYRQKISELGNIEGYIPHIFHEYFIQKKLPNGNVEILDSARSIDDAIRKANELAKASPDDNFLICAKQREFPGEADAAVVMGDNDYMKTMQRLADANTMTVDQAKKMTEDMLKRTPRNRFLGATMHRKDVKGYEQDTILALRMYLNQAGRYAAMQDFKRNSINYYEQQFGAFDSNKVMENNKNAEWARNFISDVNGNPTWVEKHLNSFLHTFNKSQEWANGRPAIWLAHVMTYPMTIAKLGILNPSSALLNFTQLGNVAAAFDTMTRDNDGRLVRKERGTSWLGKKGAAHYISEGIKLYRKAQKDPAMEKLLYDTLGLKYQIGIDVAGGYSRSETSNNPIGKARNVLEVAKDLSGKSMYFFREADTLCRGVTLMGAYQKALDDGLNHAEAVRYAKEANDKTNFNYSTADAPAIFRRWGPLGSVILQFKKYPVKQIELMMDTFMDGYERGGAKTAAWNTMKKFAPYAFVSGITGVPFYGLIMGLMSAVGGAAAGDDDWDADKKLKELIFDTMGYDSIMARGAVYGGLAMLGDYGINVGSRVGVGDFMGVSTREETMLGQLAQFSTLLSSVNQVSTQIRNENFIETLKAISPFIGNAGQAIVGESRTTNHRLKYRYENGYERFVRLLGFNPINETLEGEINSMEYMKYQEGNKAKSRAITEFLDAEESGNRSRINKAVQELNDLEIKAADVKKERDKRNMTASDRRKAQDEQNSAKKKSKPKTYSESDYLK